MAIYLLAEDIFSLCSVLAPSKYFVKKAKKPRQGGPPGFSLKLYGELLPNWTRFRRSSPIQLKSFPQIAFMGAGFYVFLGAKKKNKEIELFFYFVGDKKYKILLFYS